MVRRRKTEAGGARPEHRGRDRLQPTGRGRARGRAGTARARWGGEGAHTHAHARARVGACCEGRKARAGVVGRGRARRALSMRSRRAGGVRRRGGAFCGYLSWGVVQRGVSERRHARARVACASPRGAGRTGQAGSAPRGMRGAGVGRAGLGCERRAGASAGTARFRYCSSRDRGEVPWELVGESGAWGVARGFRRRHRSTAHPALASHGADLGV